VLDWLRQQSVRVVRGFLGLAGYYRHFIKDYGALAEPLTRFLRKVGFCWSEETVFCALQQALMTVPVLQLPDFDCDFVECDASGSGVGAVLHQGGGRSLSSVARWTHEPMSASSLGWCKQLSTCAHICGDKRSW
jgi:hypothetical protein